MRVNGTIHKRAFDGTERWYFLEELPCDIFIGVLMPNDSAIMKTGVVIDDSEVKGWFEECSIAHAEVQWILNPDSPGVRRCRYFDIKPGFWER